MRAHWAYLKVVLRHKWFVLLASRQMGVPLWIAFIHDLSKFSPAEWNAYVMHEDSRRRLEELLQEYAPQAWAAIMQRDKSL